MMKESTTYSFFCPSCGKEVSCAHPDITLVTCSCGDTSFLNTQRRPSKKAVFEIFSPTDQIQPGTTGEWNGKKFRVLGRFRAWFDESVWNYWTVKFDDRLAYLGEGYGIYVMYEPEEGFVGWAGKDHRNANPEKLIQLTSDKLCVLERINTAAKWDIEGEVWMPEAEFSWISYDFAHDSGYHAEVFEFRKGYPIAFALHFVERSALHLQNLRSVEKQHRAFTCTSCGTSNTIIGYPETQCFTCRNCDKPYVIENGVDLNPIKHKRLEEVPAMPIGSQGEIRGLNYTVIGFAVKQEKSSYASEWREYTLYHPEEGFAYLSEYDGHWTFLREEWDAPMITAPVGSFDYGDEDFQLYNTYTYKLIGAKGQFVGNIFNDEGKKVWEYISPPELWTKENNKTEGVSWFKGTHISGKELNKAFGNNIALPDRKGIGAVQPTGYINIADLMKGTLVAILVLLAVHLITSTSREQTLFQDDLSFDDSTNRATRLYGPFEFTKRMSSVELNFYANLDNSWVEMNATLVNAKTGEEFSVEKGAEFYSGYEGGEKWTEGGRSAEAYFSKIPRGTYKMEIIGIRPSPVGTFDRVPGSMSVTAIYDTPYHSNFFLFAGIIAAIAFLWYLYAQWIEQRRWSNSPYSPYEEDE
jgi:hypothetical protein